jgi:hypothetical protein
MGMKAAAANQLEVYFNKDTFLTFKMHADLHMDLLRWLQAQAKRLEVMGKRADKMESSAIELGIEENDRFVEMTGQADALRTKGGDALDVMVEYIERACNGWTDYYEDDAAEARNEPLPFDAKNITRIGVIKLNKVIEAFNQHYGLTEQSPGEAKSESLPALSPQEDRVAGTIPIGTSTSAPTAP